MYLFKAAVANCLMMGEEISTYGERSYRDKVIFNCNSFKLTFIQKPEIIENRIDFRDTCTVTTEVSVEFEDLQDVEKLGRTLDDICWLLSFACLSKIGCPSYEISNGHKTSTGIVGKANFFRPSLDIMQGKNIREFVDQVFDNYKFSVTTRKLNVVIDYLVESDKQAQPTEVKLILLFVTLENLKHTYAEELNIPFKKGFFRKNARVSKKSKRMVEDAYKFEELLEMMFKSVGMNPILDTIIDLRNEIVHSGLSVKTHGQQFEMYCEIHDIIREYFFRLLGFKGVFPTYSSRGTQYKTLK
ncbi:hypothetical protein [Undibacterium sp. TC9W]|uniref:hypothetical protein n=1 Tax=Undibacterium sp. TC9W TaxID=3413053 RepID=UPI003BEFDE18